MQLLNDEREPYECESPGIYFCEIFNALKDAGASVFIVCHDPWHANISFKKSSCELTFCDVVKMEIEMFGGVTMHASPDDIVQLILLLQKIRVPHDKLLKESLKQYNCKKIMEVTAMHLKADHCEVEESYEVRTNKKQSLPRSPTQSPEPELRHQYTRIWRDS